MSSKIFNTKGYTQPQNTFYTGFYYLVKQESYQVQYSDKL